MATVTTIPADITNLKKEITSIKSDVAKKLESAGGTITGDLTVVGGISGELSGNASTATKLKTARKINNVSFDGTSDINLTPKNIGALPITGGTLTGGLTADGEIISKSANGLRIAYGNYGFFIRNDGNFTHFMLTNSGDSMGGWNSFRPFYIQNSTGGVTIGHGLTVAGQVVPSNYGNFDGRYVMDVRLGTRVVQTMQKGVMYEKSGHVITGLGIVGEVDGDDPAVFRPIQKYINGTWYNVAQV